MRTKTIPQRELRNNVAQVLREAEAGTEFIITVRGRPVARLCPPERRDEPRLDVDGATFAELVAATPVDEAFMEDLAGLRGSEAPAEDPWARG